MIRDYWIARCMHGWRGAFCVLDNLVPHVEVPDPDDPDDRDGVTLEGVRGLRWVCRMHDAVGWIGEHGRE